MLTYWLGEAFHGQGLMREAAPPAIAAAFRELGLEAIRAAVQPDNAASLAVIRRLGAALLGAGRIHVPARERDEDCLYWELPRPEALPARARGPAALDDGPIDLLDAALAELPGQPGGGLAGAGEQQHARDRLVEPVHDAEEHVAGLAVFPLQVALDDPVERLRAPGRGRLYGHR